MSVTRRPGGPGPSTRRTPRSRAASGGPSIRDDHHDLHGFRARLAVRLSLLLLQLPVRRPGTVHAGGLLLGLLHQQQPWLRPLQTAGDRGHSLRSRARRGPPLLTLARVPCGDRLRPADPPCQPDWSWRVGVVRALLGTRPGHAEPRPASRDCDLTPRRGSRHHASGRPSAPSGPGDAAASIAVSKTVNPGSSPGPGATPPDYLTTIRLPVSFSCRPTQGLAKEDG